MSENKHMKTEEHSNTSTTDDTKAETKYPCTFCGKILTSKSNLTAHQKNTQKCLIIQGKAQSKGKDELIPDKLISRVVHLEHELALMKGCLDVNNKMITHLSELLSRSNIMSAGNFQSELEQKTS